MNIYESNSTNFNSNGLGFLTDCIESKVYEILNGDYYLSFKYPVNGNLSEYLVRDNIVRCSVSNESKQLFRIKRVVKSFKEIEIYATHIFYDLLDNFLLDTAPTNLTCQTFGNWILSKTNFENNFTFQSDIEDTKSARYVRKNPVEAILGKEENSMVSLFGGEIERNNFKIIFNQHRGMNRGVKLFFGKNIQSIKMTIDTTSLYTRILPLGFDGLMLPEVYVDSPLINNYLTPKITKYEFSNIQYSEDESIENAYHNIDDAYTALRQATNELFNNGVDKPSINIKINWLELSKTEQYKDYSALEVVELGDTIQADILGISYTAQITKTVYNVLLDRIEKFEMGTMNSTIINSVNTNAQKIEQQSAESILSSTKTLVTEMLKSASGGYVYKTQNELYIMDTNNPNTAQKVWRWNLNGLGYSKTGVNGTYETALTQDGQFVADFITTGTMSADRIDGLREIISGNNQWFTFGDDGLIIHQGDKSVQLRIDEDRIAFTDNNGNIINEWSIIDGTNRSSILNLGNYMFKPRQNGSLDIKHI